MNTEPITTKEFRTVTVPLSVENLDLKLSITMIWVSIKEINYAKYGSQMNWSVILSNETGSHVIRTGNGTGIPDSESESVDLFKKIIEQSIRKDFLHGKLDLK